MNSTDHSSATAGIHSRLFTIREVADLAGVSIMTVRRWIDHQGLQIHRMGWATMPGTRRYSPTKTNRSKVPKTNRFREVRRSTLICCRRTRISASSLTLERN